MKQPQQHSTAQTTDTPTALSRRRLMGQVVLGGAVALVLSACGGGGSSSDSSQDVDLLAVYNKLSIGMTISEVTALVGRVADESSGPDRSWSEGNQILYVDFRFGDGTVISGARWDQISPARTLSKAF